MEPDKTPTNWWGLGLAAGLMMMLVANGIIIWFAVNNADTVVASYNLEGR